MQVWTLKGRNDEMHGGMWLRDDMLAALVGFAEDDQLQHAGNISRMSEGQVRCVTQVWILKGRNDEVYRGMWVRAMDEMLARLVGFAENDQLQYVGDINGYVRAHIVPRHVALRFSTTVFRSLDTAGRHQSKGEAAGSAGCCCEWASLIYRLRSLFVSTNRHRSAKDHVHTCLERALRIDHECRC